MSSLSRELVFLILQFLDEEKFRETVHKLEQESGFYFNMRYFEDLVTNGEWDDVEKYLSGFTKVDDNRYSMKIFFEIRKQKYLEALDKRDRAKAVEILVKDLKVFAAFNEDLFKEITQLLTLENFRENEQLSKYGDTKSARSIMLAELKKLIEANPLFRDKLQFPTLKNSRLRTLINQSLNWQHQLCKNPRPNPDIKTLFVDHTCGQPNGARAPSPVTNPLMGAVPKPGPFPPLTAHAPFQPPQVALTTSLAGWMANPSSVAHPSASAGPIGLTTQNNSAILKRPRTPPTNNSAMDYQTADSEHVLKRSRPFAISDEVNNLPVNILPVTYNNQSHGQSSYSSDDLPKNVVANLNQSSPVKSMDFHPVQQILLLVGTNMGDVIVWEVGSRTRITHRNFKVWDLGTCSMPLQASLANDYTASVNRVMWSPDGTLFGVAYSKHMVHIYSYHGGDDIRNHLEIEAHVGSVNDLAFSYPNKQLCVVTCGEDRLIKVWDAVTGTKQHSFEGHEAPVYSICPHHKENIQFIFSTATDGKIKAWLYDNVGSRVDYDAPGHSSTMMAYSADGTRLFSCGTNKEGESYLVEWNEKEGHVKRTYHGLGKRPGDFVHFDTAKNRFLVAGDEFMVKFWDMDNNDILTSTDADGGLPASPCVRFNKEGILLAVSTSDSSIKILANADRIRLLRTVDNQPSDASRITLGPLMKDSGSMANVKPRIANESGDDSQIWKLTEINEPLQCRSIRLPDNSPAARVSRLIYTESGLAILALSSNAAHKVWKWQQSDQNLTGRATTNVLPQLWQPPGGNLMTNDISDTNPEDAVPCFALSKNHARLVSASGGKISLFKMQNFQTMSTFMPQPPASTYLASYPQDNNIIAIGMEDPSIQIDSDQVDAVCKKLKGHQRIIKGFDFSTVITVVVFSGSDSQTMTTFVTARQAATFLAWLPQDNDIIAIGMEDSSIQIYNVQVDEFKAILRGHQKRITGLAFSSVLKVLVSSGADSQLCVWSADGWEKQASCFLQMPTRLGASPLADTRVQFNVDQIHLLVVHETHIATYEATKLECLQQWVTREASGPITDATYSCNGQSIYVSFEDGSIGVFAASTLRFTCRINPAAYIPPNPNLRVYPLAIAANPFEPNQFALGLTDGSVHIFEPLECEGEWGASPPVEDGVGPSTTSGTTSSDQPPLPMADEASLPQIWATRLRPRWQQPPPCDLGTATVKKERKKRRC